MSRRAVIFLFLAVALGFSTGWFFGIQGRDQGNRTLKIFGMQQDAFADLKSKAKIEELAWISPSVAVSYCGIQKFEIGNASEGLEWAIVPMQLTSDKQLNCIFELATQPSKYDLRFEISASKN